MLFTSIAFAELLGTFAVRSESVRCAVSDRSLTARLLAQLPLTVALQILLVALPVTRDLLGLEPLDATHWGFAIALALACLAFVDIDKAILRRAPMHR
ncbi:MAG: Cation transporting ATPase, C-terminus [Actinomycetota bacterium]|nr:Cation transporting ATPase, C-terminus [Actinomycetota bacterium]